MRRMQVLFKPEPEPEQDGRANRDPPTAHGQNPPLYLPDAQPKWARLSGGIAVRS